jgi:hypothetical protein
VHGKWCIIAGLKNTFEKLHVLIDLKGQQKHCGGKLIYMIKFHV